MQQSHKYVYASTAHFQMLVCMHIHAFVFVDACRMHTIMLRTYGCSNRRFINPMLMTLDIYALVQV